MEEPPEEGTQREAGGTQNAVRGLLLLIHSSQSLRIAI